MPDVQIWYQNGIFQRGSDGNHAVVRIKEIVAKRMDCRDDSGRLILHDPESQIDVLTFAVLDPFHSSKAMVVKVEAYDWPDRMADISERLMGIGNDIAEELLVFGAGDISVSFNPLPRGDYPKECWVKV